MGKAAESAGLSCALEAWIVFVEPALPPAGQAELGEGGSDPVMLGLAERHRVDRPAGHDGPLEGRVPAPQDRGGAQGLAEAAHGGDLGAGGGHHVHVDPMVGWSVAEGPHSIGRPAGKTAGSWGWKPSSSRAWVTAGRSAGWAGSSRSMMPLPANPATEELPTCSAGVAGQLVAMRAMSRLATAGACGSAW